MFIFTACLVTLVSSRPALSPGKLVQVAPRSIFHPKQHSRSPLIASLKEALKDTRTTSVESGDSPRISAFQIQFLQNSGIRKHLAQRVLMGQTVHELINAIEKKAEIEFIVDSTLRVYSEIGFVLRGRPRLNTHFHFSFTYNHDQIITCNITTPIDKQNFVTLRPNKAIQVSFSYDVVWIETPKSFASRQYYQKLMYPHHATSPRKRHKAFVDIPIVRMSESSVVSFKLLDHDEPKPGHMEFYHLVIREQVSGVKCAIVCANPKLIRIDMKFPQKFKLMFDHYPNPHHPIESSADEDHKIHPLTVGLEHVVHFTQKTQRPTPTPKCLAYTSGELQTQCLDRQLCIQESSCPKCVRKICPTCPRCTTPAPTSISVATLSDHYLRMLRTRVLIGGMFCWFIGFEQVGKVQSQVRDLTYGIWATQWAAYLCGYNWRRLGSFFFFLGGCAGLYINLYVADWAFKMIDDDDRMSKQHLKNVFYFEAALVVLCLVYLPYKCLSLGHTVASLTTVCFLWKLQSKIGSRGVGQIMFFRVEAFILLGNLYLIYHDLTTPSQPDIADHSRVLLVLLLLVLYYMKDFLVIVDYSSIIAVGGGNKNERGDDLEAPENGNPEDLFRLGSDVASGLFAVSNRLKNRFGSAVQPVAAATDLVGVDDEE